MISLRVAKISDGAALAMIYAPYVEGTPITFEYVPPSAVEFSERIASKIEKYPFIVAEDGERIVAYAYASQFRVRAAFGWTAELSVYVDKDYHGKGIGKRLYSALIELVSMQGITNCVGTVVPPNAASEALHASLGFTLAGTMKNVGFKLGRWHDMMIFEKRLSSPATPSEIIPFSRLDREKVISILKA